MEDYLNKNYIRFDSPFAIIEVSNLLLKHLSLNIDNFNEIVILCIGTDRSTGDSLGPLVGHKLTPHLLKYDKIHLLGTLDEPIHAKNLIDTIEKIKLSYPNPFVLAIDASLGHLDSIGQIIIIFSRLFLYFTFE